MFGGL
jgi:hypothetical protein